MIPILAFNFDMVYTLIEKIYYLICPSKKPKEPTLSEAIENATKITRRFLGNRVTEEEIKTAREEGIKRIKSGTKNKCKKGQNKEKIIHLDYRERVD